MIEIMLGRMRRESLEAEQWQVSEGPHDGHRIVPRFDVGAKRIAGNSEYGIQIGVAVRFSSPQPDGMPPQDERPALDVVEDTISLAIAGQGVLVGVITTNGMREFVI